MEKWEKVEFYVLLATVIIGGVISILEFFGVLDNVTWLRDRIPVITLLLATLIAGSLLIGTYNVRQFLKSILPTGTIRRLDRDEESRYMCKRIREAKRSVDDLTWADPSEPTVMATERDRREYLRAIEDVSKRIRYREIMMFCGSDERVSKARRLIDRAGEGYQLRGYDDLPKSSPPRWQFLIVDAEEVILKGLAVRQPDIVDYFCRYYNSQWVAAARIWPGDISDLELLEEAERALGRTGDLVIHAATYGVPGKAADVTEFLRSKISAWFRIPDS